MTTPSRPVPPHKAARQERLEDRLRANLKRRKDAARARIPAEAAPAGSVEAAPSGSPGSAPPDEKPD